MRRRTRDRMLAVVATLYLVVAAHPQQTSPAPAEGAKTAEQSEQKPAGEATAAADAKPKELTRAEEIAADTKELFRLSAEMRAEAAKTYKDQLSLTVLKKAEQIEKLAKSLKALMSAEAADNKHKK